MTTHNVRVEEIVDAIESEIRLALIDAKENPAIPKAHLYEPIAQKLRTTLQTFATECEARGREEERESKNGAYKERDMLVCALSKLFPAYLARHNEEDTKWENDWRWIVYIDLPTGQVSWHIHDSEREMFNHLEVKENNWDGHNTERKYERLTALQALTPPTV